VPISLISLIVLDQASGIPSSQGISNIIDVFVAQPFLKSLNIDAVGLKTWINLTISGAINSTIQSIPIFGLNLIITLNCMFYLLYSWDELVSHLKKYLPFEDKHKDKIATKLGYATSAIVHSSVLIALLEGAIAFVGFSLVGVPSSLLLAVLVFILSFAPSVGPELIWIPLALYYFAISQYFIMGGVIITGLIILIGVELFFNSRFVGSKSHIHPFIMLIGVLGGIFVFGIFGFIIGPLVLVNSINMIELAMWSDMFTTKKH
jgi:predicted PurR-regulated permease PerM